MGFRVHQRLPRQVILDKGQTLDLTVSGGTITSPKLTVKIGGRTIVDDEDATDLSYALSVAELDGEVPNDEWVEQWSGLLDGEPWSYQLGGHVVRCAFYGIADDSDLQAVHPDILDRLPNGETTTERFRNLATDRIQRHLIARGRRPWLIFDAWSLLDAEVALSLHFWAADCARRFPDSPQYRMDADKYERRYREEMQLVSFRYDDNETGTIARGDSRESPDGPSSVVLTAGTPRFRRRRR